MFSLLHPFHQSSDLAIDFGTAYLRIGDARGTHLRAIPSKAGTRPALHGGVVTDTAAAAALLHEALRPFGHQRNLRVLACAPSDASEDERRMFLAALREAGAATSALIPEPLAASIGANVDISEGKPSMLIDFGEGVVDCAVIVEKRIHASVTFRGGCSAWRAGLAAHLRKTAGIVLSDTEAESLLRRVGLETSWQDLELPGAERRIPAGLVGAFLQEKVGEIVEMLLRFLKTLPPEVCAEVISNGIAVTGGGTLIPDFVYNCRQNSGLPLVCARRPLDAVIDGACAILGPTTRFDLWDDLHHFWNVRTCPATGQDL